MDAVYAIAHAIDNMIKERCKEVPFHECEEIQPSPMGYELLRHIHNVSFVGRQNTSVSNLSKVSSWLNVAKVHTDKKLHNVWYIRMTSFREKPKQQQQEISWQNFFCFMLCRAKFFILFYYKNWYPISCLLFLSSVWLRSNIGKSFIAMIHKTSNRLTCNLTTSCLLIYCFFLPSFFSL